MQRLVIVESKVKSDVIEKYLDEGYKVLPSIGHVRDLATSGKDGLGLDIEGGTFQPEYKRTRGKAKVINEMKKVLKKCDELILATDPDREGEAIAWHLKELLEFDGPTSRITFNEVTEEKIKEALNNKRDIDMDLVHAQEARRVIDRIIGFRLSKYVKSRIGAPSAGRVQSVALKLVCEKEEEIKAFNIETWYEVKAKALGDTVHFELYHDVKDNVNNNDEESTDEKGKIIFKTKDEVDTFIKNVNPKFKEIDSKVTRRNNKAPLPLDMVLAIRRIQSKFGYSNGSITVILQKLFNMGHISYPRTDSNRLSDEFKGKVKKYLEENKICEFAEPESKGGAQDAHESIRPTKLSFDYKNSKKLDQREKNVYELILHTTLQACMPPVIRETETHIYSNGSEKFSLSKTKTIGVSYLLKDEKYAWDFQDEIQITNIEPKETSTQPPARYRSASLIKTMKDIGIGRPSTYGTIVKKLVTTEYCFNDKNTLTPTESGMGVNKGLQENFSDVIREDYTAEIEQTFDLIAQGKVNYIEYIKMYYNAFEPIVQKVLANTPEEEPSDKPCPECGSKTVKKFGRFGPYLKCQNEECGKNSSLKQKAPTVELSKCDQCKEGMMVLRKQRFKHQYFAGCNNFPKCKTLRKLTPEEEEKYVAPIIEKLKEQEDA